MQRISPYDKLCLKDEFLARLDSTLLSDSQPLDFGLCDPDDAYGVNHWNNDIEFDRIYQSHMNSYDTRFGLTCLNYLMPWVDDVYINHPPRDALDLKWLEYVRQDEIYKQHLPSLHAMCWIKVIYKVLSDKMNLFSALMPHFNSFQEVLKQMIAGRRFQRIVPAPYDPDTYPIKREKPFTHLEHRREIDSRGRALEKVYAVVDDNNNESLLLEEIYLGRPIRRDTAYSFLHPTEVYPDFRYVDYRGTGWRMPLSESMFIDRWWEVSSRTWG